MVTIVPDKKLYSAIAAERIHSQLTELLGNDETIIITAAEHISLEANGKCCFVKREQPSKDP
jgi:hypothetical protein